MTLQRNRPAATSVPPDRLLRRERRRSGGQLRFGDALARLRCSPSAEPPVSASIIHYTFA